MNRGEFDQSLTDDQLCAQVAARGELGETARQAGTLLYQRHAPRLLAFLAARVARSDLEDVHQQIWERVWRQLPTSFAGGSFRGWLFQIARNMLIDRFRRHRSELEPMTHELPDHRASPPDLGLLESERRTALARCFENLEDRAAEVVRGRLAGVGYPELCQRLQISPAQAYKLFHVAKERLTECVQQALP